MTLFERALTSAAEKHRGMRRRFNGLPYILHPMEAAVIAGSLAADEELLAAALLHDVVEDAGVTLEEIGERFTPRVMALVAAETEDKRADQPPEATWHIRKEEALTALRHASDPAVKKLFLSDKLSNLRSLHEMKIREGDAMWRHFHQQDEREQAWYFGTVLELTRELSATQAWREYQRLFGEVFGEEG